MNIYEIASYYYDDAECDNQYIYDYLLHEKKFSEEEFTKMCEKGLGFIEVGNCLDLKRYLIDNYGFKEIKPLMRYEFEEL